MHIAQDHTPEMKRVTMNLPKNLVDEAAAYLEKPNFTAAVKDALREAMHRKACEEMMELKGKVDFEYNWRELRAMDDE